MLPFRRRSAPQPVPRGQEGPPRAYGTARFGFAATGNARGTNKGAFGTAAFGFTGAGKARSTGTARFGFAGTGVGTRARALAQFQFAATGNANPSGVFANGYRFQYEVRLRAWPDADPAPGLLLPFGETGLADFKSAANGGNVQSAVGRDIRFEDAAGTKLGHVLFAYDPAAGTIAALVNLPNRNLLIAESVFLYVGKAGLGSSEEDTALARAGGWEAWNTGASTSDFTGLGRTMTTSTAVGAAPPLGGGSWPAGSFDGSTSFRKRTSAELDGKAGVSWLALLSGTVGATGNGQALNIATPTLAELSLAVLPGNAWSAILAVGGSSFVLNLAGGTHVTGRTHCLAGGWSSGTAMQLAIDGTTPAPATAPGVATGTTTLNDELELGRGGAGTGFAYWSGAIGPVLLCSRRVAQSALECMTAAFVDPRRVYGLSAANLAADTNFGPVAQPVDVLGTAGTPLAVDVGAAGFDRNLGDALTVTDASTVSGSVTPSFSGGVVTLNGSVVGDSVVAFGLRDPPGKASRGRIYASLVAAPTFRSKPRTAVRTVNVATSADLVRELASASTLPGTHIVLADGTYGGNFTIARNGSASAEIVVRALNPGKAVLTGIVTVTGNFNFLYQLKFQGGLAGDFRVQIGSRGCFVSRCSFANGFCGVFVSNGVGGGNVRVEDNTLCYNEFLDTGGGSSATEDQQDIRLQPTNTPTATNTFLNTRLYYNYHRTAIGGSPGPAIYVGTTENNTFYAAGKDLGTIVERCLMAPGGARQSFIRLKSHGNVIRQNTNSNGGNFENREGSRNQLIANDVVSDSMQIHGDFDLFPNPTSCDLVVNWNRFRSGANLALMSGYAHRHHPSANGVTLIGNDTGSGKLVIPRFEGNGTGGGPNDPLDEHEVGITGIVIEAHTPRADYPASGLNAAVTWRLAGLIKPDGTPATTESDAVTIRQTTTATPVPLFPLTAADVGPLANLSGP